MNTSCAALALTLLTLALALGFFEVGAYVPITPRVTRSFGFGRRSSVRREQRGNTATHKEDVANELLRRDGISGGFGVKCAMLPSSTPDVLRSGAAAFVANSPTAVARGFGLVLSGVAAAAVAVVNRRRILWPGSTPDPSFDEPLPPGSLGCPFFGCNLWSGSASFFKRTSAELGNPRLWKFFFLGKPYANLSGVQNLKRVLNTEFTPSGVRTGSSRRKASSEMFGGESLLLVQDGAMHDFLRRLIGASMTPTAIAAAMPALERTANEQIDRMLANDTVVAEAICTNFTFDVAWRQLLGLDLNTEEAEEFHRSSREWMGGLFSTRARFLPDFVLRRTRAFKAHRYLVSLIEEKIQHLETSGPDNSTLSAMLFAKDDNESAKLSYQQVIDNAKLLILAGSETTAGALTNAILFLGLHPDVWRKVKEEQRALVRSHGQAVTKSQLDQDCTYLDAVVKETLRLRPLSAVPRSTKGTLIVDGNQIPRGWQVLCNIRQTHELDPAVRVGDGNAHMHPVRGFDPERWMDDATLPREFIPFGAGPRFCLGSNLALVEMKVFLTLLARRVDFDLVGTTRNGPFPCKGAVVPRARDGVVVSASAAALEDP